ncbi:tetratricopeptide repeat protein [Psychroflexus sp. ALD_RP9]|uniref:tetratricopeptide repeat protein n=1 Tax=Psychroflexus sp. ALD_RP9 TaxID=2777186 RepID=UPI001A8E2585|nr:hypothetical protein [Psychroflexus sp. ALD_RP9]QSS96247.1 hypothetical protein IMZ30_07205 [Psychroflexus sp. ALD_RP9]
MYKFWKTTIQVVLACLLISFKAQSQASQLDSLYAIGEYSKAIGLYQNQIPSTFNERISLAKIYLAKQQNSKAINLYKLALNQKQVLKHRFTYAQLLLGQKQYKVADSVLTQLHIDYPKNAEFVYQLGLSKKQSNTTNLDQYFAKAIALDSTHLRAYYELAYFYTNIKSYKKAQETCLNALKIDSKHKKILGLLAQVLYNDHAYKLALTYFKAFDKHYGVPEFMLKKMAFSAWYLQDLELAINYYNRLLQLEPKSYRYHQNIAKVYNASGNFKSGMRHAFSALRNKDVSQAKIYYELGVAFLGTKQYKLAVSTFEKVIDETPSYELAYVKLARAADLLYQDKSKVLPYFERYETYFDEVEDADYKDFMLRRLSDIRRKLHFDSAK